MFIGVCSSVVTLPHKEGLPLIVYQISGAGGEKEGLSGMTKSPHTIKSGLL